MSYSADNRAASDMRFAQISNVFEISSQTSEMSCLVSESAVDFFNMSSIFLEKSQPMFVS